MIPRVGDRSSVASRQVYGHFVCQIHSRYVIDRASNPSALSGSGLPRCGHCPHGGAAFFVAAMLPIHARLAHAQGGSPMAENSIPSNRAPVASV